MAGDYENGARRRPEEIVADAFAEHVPVKATDGWSVRSRRTVLLAMAAAGAVMVVAGLVLTSGLGPSPASPRPLESGPDASVLARSLLRPVAEPPPAPTTTAPGTLLPTPGPGSSVRAPAANAVVPSAPSTSTATAITQQPGTTQPPSPTTSTTRPCPLVSDRLASAVSLPPLCP